MATRCTLSRLMNALSWLPSLLSGLAETWWNSSMAIRRLSKASRPSSSTAKRKVACVQTSTLSLLFRKVRTASTLDLATRGSSMPGALHRFHCGATCQSQ
ncbi:hypothetical protein D3C81_881080 [compost metagenome]